MSRFETFKEISEKSKNKRNLTHIYFTQQAVSNVSKCIDETDWLNWDGR